MGADGVSSKNRREVLVWEPGRKPFLRRMGPSPLLGVLPLAVGAAGVLVIWALVAWSSLPYLLGLAAAFGFGRLLSRLEDGVSRRVLSASRRT